MALISRKVSCWAAAGDIELTNTDDEFKVAMRQVAATFAQLEKTRLVKKLKAARDRKRAAGERVEGRKPLAETRPELVELVRKLARARPKGKKRSLRAIARELKAAGHLNSKGSQFEAMQVKRILDQLRQKN